LTNANHVIFVSPFLAESQQTYDQAMTQAMGRARRYGQTKPVHIYSFLSLKTIDVDILQLRSGKILAANVAPAPEFSPFELFVPSTLGLVDAAHGEKGEFGSAETSKLLMENDDA
jgi:SNF2 family DNA or RNA helicase